MGSIEEPSKPPTRAEIDFYEGLVNFVLVLKGDRSSYLVLIISPHPKVMQYGKSIVALAYLPHKIER